MSIFKPFTTSDVVVSPFKVNKLFSFSGTAALTGSGINIFEGKNINPTLWISGSNPTGYISTQDKYLVYRSVRELYYYNYIYGDDGSPATTASFNVDGTITTTTQYTPNAYNYLPNTLPANRYFPTGSNDIVGVIAIPSNLFGEYIKPGTFTLTYESGSLTDDGEGGLLRNLEKVGDIIYEHGMIIITNDGTLAGNGYGFVTYGSALYNINDSTFIQDIITSQNLSCEFESTVTIYETQYKCTVRENEYNFTQNPTVISGSSNSGVIYNFATGSFFTPYATTIGLYDNNYNLLAIAKLAQPLPLSAVTDTSILVNLDL
jgi:hypothetical protein